MTQKQTALPANLVVTQLLWTGTGFLQEGTSYPVDEANETAVALAFDLIGKGFLASREDVARQQNPEAAEAAGQAARLALRVKTLEDDKATLQVQQTGLQELLSTARSNLETITGQKTELQTTLGHAQEALQRLQGQKTALESQASGLQAELEQAKSEAETLRTQVESLTAAQGQAPVFSEADVKDLAEYRAHAGELLPANFPARAKLLAAGYYRVDQLLEVDRASLIAIDGIAEKSADAILAAVAQWRTEHPEAGQAEGGTPAEPVLDPAQPSAQG